jgi:hypothetical protein
MADVLTKNDERYPIGKFESKATYTVQEIQECIDRITALPALLEAEVQGLTDSQLDTPYREGGWTVRQVVHHVPDSHMNAYIRMKWALTEQNPLIKAYDEKGWAETQETKSSPEISISFLKALHTKWVALIKTLTASDLQKGFIHPDTKQHIPMSRLIATYAWHGDHHLAHITSLKKRMGWDK